MTLVVLVLGIAASTIFSGWQVYQAQIGEQRIRDRYRKKNAEFCRDAITDLLRIGVQIVRVPGADARANVFLVDHAKRQIHIAYHYKMDGDPDLGVRFREYEGCAGHAWAKNEQCSADLAETTSRDLQITWKMSPEQIRLTQDVRAVLCTPVRNPHNPNNVIGVFSLDSNVDLASSRFGDDTVAEYALQIAGLVAWILYLGDMVVGEG